MKEKILKLRSEGKSYRQIQKKLECSSATIAWHCSPKVKKNILAYKRKLNKRLRNERRSFVKRVKSRFGCIDCGNKDWRVLDFDHVKDNKFANVGDLVSHRNIVRIKEEMRKCEIRCANCHRIVTYDRANPNIISLDSVR